MIINFLEKKMERDNPSLDEIISSLTGHNCDRNRPYLEQQPLRAKMEITGLTRRDISDCMVLGILSCKEFEEGDEELPMVYVSEKGNKFKDFDSLLKSGEGYFDSYIDPERVTYNDLYGWDLNNIDPVAAVQNMACYLERMMGVYPALIDG